MRSLAHDFALLWLCLAAPLASAADATVSLTVTWQTGTDSGATYTNFHQAGDGTGSEFVIGIETDVTAMNGTPVNLDRAATFCIELEEPIGVTSYTNFFSGGLAAASAGRAGEAGSASSGIPVGGIGALAAARVRYLFDNYYQSSTLTDWTVTTSEPRTHAFQIALWEISHDTDLSLSLTSGYIYIGAQTGGSSQALRINAVNLATTYLDALAADAVTASYQSTTWDVFTLTSTTGNGPIGNQDLVFAKAIGSPDQTLIRTFVPVPEPYSSLLALAGLAGILRRRRA